MMLEKNDGLGFSVRTVRSISKDLSIRIRCHCVETAAVCKGLNAGCPMGLNLNDLKCLSHM